MMPPLEDGELFADFPHAPPVTPEPSSPRQPQPQPQPRREHVIINAYVFDEAVTTEVLRRFNRDRERVRRRCQERATRARNRRRRRKGDICRPCMCARDSLRFARVA